MYMKPLRVIHCMSDDEPITDEVWEISENYDIESVAASEDRQFVLAIVDADTPEYVQEEIVSGERDSYFPDYENPYIPESEGAVDPQPMWLYRCEECESPRHPQEYWNESRSEWVRGRLCDCDRVRLETKPIREPTLTMEQFRQAEALWS